MKSRNDAKQGESTSSIVDQLKMSLELGVAKGLSVIPTQPLQVVMRMQQAALASKNQPRLLTVKQVAAELWQSGNSNKLESISSLYRGTIPAMTKEFLKNVIYKGVLITGAPGLAATVIPGKVKDTVSTGQYNFMKAVIAGTIAGTGDVILGGAFESWATFRAEKMENTAAKGRRKVRQKLSRKFR